MKFLNEKKLYIQMSNFICTLFKVSIRGRKKFVLGKIKFRLKEIERVVRKV